MSPTPLTAGVLAAIAIAAAVVGELALLAAIALVAAVAVDARAVRRAPAVERRVPAVLSRGVPVELEVVARAPAGSAVRIRQAVPPDLALAPREGDGELHATLVPRRRGRHELPAVGTRSTGPLRLASWTHHQGEGTPVSVYPDLVAARRLALSVRRGQFRDQGVSARGPLGLGTDFELVRDYLPDDDIRQVNWRATARLGRPMSNQYRVEQDRELVLLVDAGRLAAAELPGHGDGAERPAGTVLDAALDALAAVALVADAVGDRCGAVAFDREVRVALAPRRAGGRVVVQALHDLEPRLVDSDYEAAFRRVEGSKRAFVLIFSDLLEPVAARSLADAVPVLARRHSVAVASPSDPGVRALASRRPDAPEDVAWALAAAEVEAARDAAAATVRAGGAAVVDAPPGRLAQACVAAYLRAKSRALL